MPFERRGGGGEQTHSKRGRLLGCAVKPTTRPFCCRETDPVLIVQKFVWASGPVWTGAESLIYTNRPYQIRRICFKKFSRLHFRSFMYEYIKHLLQNTVLTLDMFSINSFRVFFFTQNVGLQKFTDKNGVQWFLLNRKLQNLNTFNEVLSNSSVENRYHLLTWQKTATSLMGA
jgi:hypothetical protein